MFQLAQYIWLWALTVLAVPVIIHLWNTRQGKTLKIGSIALFTETARSHARSFKLSEWLLLALRCLLLIILVLLLATPFWIRQNDPASHKGWLLIGKNDVKEAYKNHQSEVDSLLRSGYRFHYFNNGFKEEDFEAALARNPDTAALATINHWRLLKDLDHILPATIPVYLITDNKLQSFGGNRPAVNLNLSWQTYEARDTLATWPEAAFETIDDSVCIVIGNSTGKGTWYTHRTLAHKGTDAQLRLIVEDGNTFVEYVPQAQLSKKQRIGVDTATMKVTICTGSSGGDASYIRAAIEAICDITRRKITVNITPSKAAISTESDWVFWLSDDTVPAPIWKSKVLMYNKGEVQRKFSTIVTHDGEGASSAGSLASYLQIKQAASAEVQEVMWRNGFGEPLLSRNTAGTEVYGFSSRFNPQWNDMPWNSQFPQIIYDLLFAKRTSITQPTPFDQRKLEAQQVVPVNNNKEVFPKTKHISKTDLSAWLWLLAFGLFLLERSVVYTSKSRRDNG